MMWFDDVTGIFEWLEESGHCWRIARVNLSTNRQVSKLLRCYFVWFGNNVWEILNYFFSKCIHKYTFTFSHQPLAYLLIFKIICLFIVCSMFLYVLKKNYNSDFPDPDKMQNTGCSWNVLLKAFYEIDKNIWLSQSSIWLWVSLQEKNNVLNRHVWIWVCFFALCFVPKTPQLMPALLMVQRKDLGMHCTEDDLKRAEEEGPSNQSMITFSFKRKVLAWNGVLQNLCLVREAGVI